MIMYNIYVYKTKNKISIERINNCHRSSSRWILNLQVPIEAGSMLCYQFVLNHHCQVGEMLTVILIIKQ